MYYVALRLVLKLCIIFGTVASDVLIHWFVGYDTMSSSTSPRSSNSKMSKLIPSATQGALPRLPLSEHVDPVALIDERIKVSSCYWFQDGHLELSWKLNDISVGLDKVS